MKAKLTPVERDILSRLSLNQLQFLSKVAHDKDFVTFIKITEILVDYEKNFVFKINESDPALATIKASAR